MFSNKLKDKTRTEKLSKYLSTKLQNMCQDTPITRHINDKSKFSIYIIFTQYYNIQRHTDFFYRVKNNVFF